MDILKQYNIPWKGLSNGSHHFDLEVSDKFFAAFEDSEIRGGNLKVGIDVDRSASMLLIDVSIEGEVTVECDRCLGSLELPVDYNGELKVKFSDEIEDYDGDILWMNPADGEVPMAQYIYESIVLSLPYQKVHGEDADGNYMCDADMMSRFRIISQDEFDAMDVDTQTLGDNPESRKLAQLKIELEEDK